MKETAHNIKTGIHGEQLATAYLAAKGYEILEQNYRTGRMEVDIIACDKQFLVFVEVKTRSSSKFGFPEASVKESKKQHIRQAAEAYLSKSPTQLFLRFDIVSVMLRNGKHEITHFKDAF
ncbi:YraN family protein [Limibacter armeniacum]|uniref:YraN family protein n=1 Tax=Limibacter armeniacum TaxID=466084 RepID=UPI002FE61499